MKKAAAGAVNPFMSDSSGLKVCWHCQSLLERAIPACPACEKIQPPCGENVFARLTLAITYDIVPAELEHAYLLALRRFHPDRLVDAAQKERLFAQQHTAAINQAYRQLKNPYERALALLRVRHGTEFDQQPDSPDLLLEIFELREQADTLTHQKSAQEFAEKLDSLIKSCDETLSHAFHGDDRSLILKQARRYHYLSKLRDDLTNTHLLITYH